MRVLELGNYIIPAYAGMILAEQGHEVTKWVNGQDPILGLRDGQAIWRWINHEKVLQKRHPGESRDVLDQFDIVLDNFRPSTLARWGIEPAELATDVVWVSLRSEVGEVSFDILAQCRSWLEHGPYLPFYVGDTVGGLWLAFKALAAPRPGHYVVGHATCMEKLVEGELILGPQDRSGGVPWDVDAYRFDGSHAVVEYRGQTFREPVRNRTWKLAHLWHSEGRLTI